MKTEDRWSESHTRRISFTKDEVVAALGVTPPGPGYTTHVFMESYNTRLDDQGPEFVVTFSKHS